jgi:hypothetical protein
MYTFLTWVAEYTISNTSERFAVIKYSDKNGAKKAFKYLLEYGCGVLILKVDLARLVLSILSFFFVFSFLSF